MTVMTFDEAILYIKSLDVYGSVLGLENMRGLADYLDNPQDGLKFVHVTGTNGKGSTSAFITSILKEAGYKVGTYNSPAVKSDTDQFRINMDIVHDDLYAEAVSIVKEASELYISDTGRHPTRFEVETMVAFVMFYMEKCDIVVLETGLGGINDATNIINTAVLHVVTSISMDHANVLGDSLIKIAENKSGIIKTSTPVVMLDRTKSTEGPPDYTEVIKVFSDRCKEMDADLYLVDDTRENPLELTMKGAYQSENASIAIKAAEVLADMGYRLLESDIRKGLKNAEIPFRFEHIEIESSIDIILDGAHNPDGAVQFAESLKLNYPDREYIYITGIFKDKDYKEIARITGDKAIKIYTIENEKSVRALDKSVLAEVYRQYNNNVVIADSIRDALEKAYSEAIVRLDVNGNHPVICCFGSLSWLNDAKEIVVEMVRRK
ncbi:MAG: Mur ligase family protein [Lachnospiraceae bacterium]|nr:Mur ligase family protein [Lachnospiraceae bacterium]